MEPGDGITRFMRTLLDDYKQIRGKSKNSLGRPFWDVVVLTTADTAQKEAYQLQIDDKLSRNELPLELPILIVSDPPGVRVGNGGSTFTALECLESTYGSDMYKMKILMIHAGGWSQRMPSTTILGKIFSVLPHGSPPYQMLDLKLALYWPLVNKMEPGVFLVCADDFTVYSFMSSNDWKIPAKGFTALAHPSPIELGRGHGVYVIENVGEVDASAPVEIRECLRALQKPTDARMKANGALLKGDSHVFAGGIHIDGEVIYSDSSFYFGTDVMEKLLSFKKSVGDLSCEIDAYGDFLQAVGKSATNEYIRLTFNVSQQTSNLLQLRQAVFDCLNGCDLHALILNASAYIHIGTVKELLHHFCRNEIFQEQMAFEKEAFTSWKGKCAESRINDNGAVLDTSNMERGNKKSPYACMIHSAVKNESIIEEDCVIEYCDFELRVHIAAKCILSNCQLSLGEMTSDVHKLIIPENTFLHTVPIIINSSTKFVTAFFNVEDNIKKSVPSEEVESLPFLGSDIGHFMKLQGLAKKDILPHNSTGSFGHRNSDSGVNGAIKKEVKDSENVSLWNLKLFPALASMTSSLEDALLVLTPFGNHKESREIPIPLYSLADLLKFKDVKSMLNFRKSLFEKICTSHC